jgi:hypothetical protein
MSTKRIPTILVEKRVLASMFMINAGPAHDQRRETTGQRQ